MFIRRHQEVYGNTIEINQLKIIITILLIFLLMAIIVFQLILNSKKQDEQEIVAQKMLKEWFH